ncbi:hypothetical protein [Pseudomonas viridiflava]|uniref:hypothetical protein n=1 Tax=Pseudomonas viridiflava TaxID=33069 RepID=UPI000F048EA4|nr:hypothetical protein [Pseudomonas viridiflava]
MSGKGFAIGLACIACLTCTAANAEEAFILGISTHLMNFDASPKPALQLAAKAGFAAVKDDAFWSTAEPKPNQWRIIAPWRDYLSTASSLKLERLTLLDYSTSFHDNAKPRSPAVKAGYLNYVDYVTGQLGNKVDFYEIWNEWDLEAPKDPQLSADYATLVREAVPLIRKNTAEVNGIPAKILAGSVTPEGMDNGFADRLIDAGMLNLVDGLSIHPYAHCAPDGRNNPESWVQWLRDYEQHVRTRAGRIVPIYITEMAWPSHKGPCGNTAQTQAAYLARILLFARTVPNIKGLWWYDLINDGPDRTDQEHNFGLLNEDLSPKPAYGVVLALAEIIKHFTWDAQASLQSANVYQLHFSRGNAQVIAAWAVGGSRQEQIISTRPMRGPVMFVDTADPGKGQMSGEAFWRCQDGQCSAPVTLTRFPKIISLNSETVAPQRP